jgi:hypothetical protein
LFQVATATTLWPVQARKDTHMANIQPNRFVLHSNDGKTKVDYETSSFIGQPILNLTQTPGPTRHFVGSQIRKINTEIGTLVTVTTLLSIDTGSTSFSVLIPAITLTAISDQKAFSTDAIITAHSGPNSVPATGVHETYQFIPMKGEASFVIAVLEPVMGAVGRAGA